MVKQVMGPLLPLMTTLINSSLTSGDVPENMKVARISPLLKKPSLDSEHLQNYRPVSNLSLLSKLLEKVVAFKLQSYMDTHGLHNPTQPAYGTGHSTHKKNKKQHCSKQFRTTCYVQLTNTVLPFWSCWIWVQHLIPYAIMSYYTICWVLAVLFLGGLDHT